MYAFRRGGGMGQFMGVRVMNSVLGMKPYRSLITKSLCCMPPAACCLDRVKEKRAIMNLYNRENDPLDDEEELR